MSKTKLDKKDMVDDYKAKLKGSKAVYIIEPTAVTPNEASELKKKLFDLDSTFNNVKNSLFKIAMEEEGMESGLEITGKNAVIFAGEKISEAAKALKEFIKDTEKIVIKGGFLNGEEIKKEQIEALADLPSREQLLGQVVGTMNAPISGFVNVLAGNVRGIVNVLNAIKEKKQ
jgi:large subunit ribosomal protein L10